MDSFTIIFISLLSGYLLQKFHAKTVTLAKPLNQYIIYIALPAMIFLEVPKITLSTDLFIPVVVSWIVMLGSALMVLFSSYLFKFSKEHTGALMLVSVLTNSTFLGIPIIHAYFGLASLPFIIVYDQIGSFLALSIYGTMVVSYYSHKSKVKLSIIVMKVLMFPPLISLIVAFLISAHHFSSISISIFELLTSSIVPFALFAVGLQLQFRLPLNEIKPFTISLIIKLIMAPIIAILVAYLFSWDNLASQVSIMEAGMAPMITAGALASMMGLAPRLSSAIVGYGILLSFVTSGVLFRIIS
jgi:malate permease and related proteins